MNVKPVVISLDTILTGKRIHSVISEKGYTVRQIQEMLNLACPQSVYKWMWGITIPSVDNLYRLSKIFDMHMEDLLVERGTGGGTG